MAIGRVIVGRLDKRTAETLMRALNMIVIHVLADEFSQVRLTQRDDAVEALLFDRTDEAFNQWGRVRSTGKPVPTEPRP